jgi:hypothetical protein
MPHRTCVEIPQEAPAQMLAVLRRARYGDRLALHIVLVGAAGRTPTDIAAVLCDSRSSVYRTVHAYREGSLGWRSDDAGQLLPPVRRTVLFPMRRRSRLAIRPGTWIKRGERLVLLEELRVGHDVHVQAIEIAAEIP